VTASEAATLIAGGFALAVWLYRLVEVRGIHKREGWRVVDCADCGMRLVCTARGWDAHRQICDRRIE
jgi:hypothetical protein